MQFLITAIKNKEIRGGKVINDYLKTLDGNYVVDIRPENNLTTPKECRAAYFFKIDLVVASTGDERYVIHERFKAYAKIDSTKNFTVVDWRNFIQKFQEYIFEKLDIVV